MAGWIAMGLAPLLVTGCNRANPMAPDSISDAQGIVVDAVLDLPLSGVLVEAVNGPAAGQFVVTGDDGRFKLSRASQTGFITLRASRDGFNVSEAQYRQGTDLSIPMWPAGDRRLEDGQYSVTIAADPVCTALPAELRTRTYLAAAASLEASGRRFTLVLGGAEFYPTQRVIWGTSVSNTFSLYVSSWEAFMRWLDDLPIVEKVGPESYLSVQGTAKGTGISEPSSLTTDLDGTVSYCPRGAGNPLWFECAVPEVECRSAHHRLTVSLR